MQIKEYNNYFKKQYKFDFTNNSIMRARQWFWAQWNIIKGYIPAKKNIKILELGSGLGTVYSFLRENELDRNYIGLELDTSVVAYCNKFFSTHSFHNSSIEEYKGEKIDLVFAFEVLEHLSNPNDVIVKMYDLLRKDGLFIGTSPYPFKKNIYADATHRYVLSPDNWVKLFQENGFDVLVKPLSFFPFIWRIHKRLNVVIPFYVPFPYFISTTLLVAKKRGKLT